MKPSETGRYLTASRSTTKISVSFGADHRRRAGRAVGEVRRDDQLATAADLHPGYALVPAFDHFAGAEREGERFAPAPGRIEFLFGFIADADVLDGDFVAGLGFGAFAFDDFDLFQFLRRRATGNSHLRFDLQVRAHVRAGRARRFGRRESLLLEPQPATASTSAAHNAKIRIGPLLTARILPSDAKVCLIVQPLPERRSQKRPRPLRLAPTRSAGLTLSEPGLAAGGSSFAASAASILRTTPRS